MLSLKDKLLKAGVVTAEQVKKVEDDEAARKQREQERRDRERTAREARGQPREARGASRREPRREARVADDADEKRAAREHQVEEAQRWRQRLEQLKAAGKAEQYQVIRGWVTRHRIDDKAAMLTEQATRFHFAKEDGAIGHLTVEPAVLARLAAGEVGIIAFMGFNGIEHAVVPADLGRDIHQVKPEWVRSLAGITDAGITDAGITDAGSTASTSPPVGPPATDDAPDECASGPGAPLQNLPSES